MIKSRILIPVAIAILSLHPLPAAAAAGQQLDIWTWRNPVLTGNQLYNVTHGVINGSTLWVAVGVNNTILTSNDGSAWSQQPTPVNCSLYGVVYGVYNSTPLFVAVGAGTVYDFSEPNNVILTSPDGTNWTANAQSGLGTGGLLAVAFDGNGNFLAVGNNGANLYSSGGMTWTLNTAVSEINFASVAYGMVNGSPGFAAVGSSGYIFTTTTLGASWIKQTSPANSSLFGITYNSANGFVALGFGDLVDSPDGVTWHDAHDSGTAVVYANGQFVTVDEYPLYPYTYYPIYTSPGVSSGTEPWTWTTIPGSYSFDAIDWDAGSGTFVAVGPTGTVATASTDLTSWNLKSASASQCSLNAIAYGSYASPPGVNLFVAGGTTNINEGPGVIWSADGYNWIPATDPSIDSSTYANAYITGLASGNNEFVATVNTISDVNLTPRAFSVILSSSTIGLQGPVWTPAYTSPSAALTGVAYGNGSFVAVGNQGTAVWSIGLSSWTKGTGSGVPPSLNFNAVAYGSPNGTPTFVAVGKNYSGNAISYSTDGGNTWTAASGPPSSDYFTGVAYGIGPSGQPVFVAVGVNSSVLPTPGAGVVWTSLDGGQTWQQYTLPGTVFPFSGVTFANGMFVAVTLENYYDFGGTMWVSADGGTTWVQTSVTTPVPLNAVGSGDYQFIAVGNSGAILGSVLAVFPTGPGTTGFNPPPPNSPPGTPPCFWFDVMGPPGPTYGVYVSTDLINWTWLQNVSFSSTSPIQQIQDCGGSTQAFYYLGPPGP